MSNAAKDDAVEMGGRELKRVKNGLDESQVASFVDELLKERDKLAKSQDHIASLNRLAELTIVEADKLAAQIKTEATEQARAESAAIIDKAKEQARQASERKIAESVKAASEQATAIKARAEEEAVLLLENQKIKIRGELRNLVNQQFGYMLEELESLKKQAAAVQADFGNKLAESGEKNGTVTTEVGDRRATPAKQEVSEVPEASVAGITEKRDAMATELAEESDTIVAEFAGRMDAATMAADRGVDSAVTEVGARERGGSFKQGRTADSTEESSDLAKLLQVEEEPDLGKPQWEVEILAPFDISRIMEVVSFLDGLPEVANTEMIVPQLDMPSILVFLRKSINFVEVLKTIPAVASVEEVTPKTAPANGKARKVRISLAKKGK